VNKRRSAKDRQNESDKRKELNLLKYEAVMVPSKHSIFNLLHIAQKGNYI